ncbi:MAG: DnaJ domain-containing protein [Acidimicrobiales bacterium]|nr:DnaJ domain-containing protein [Acidimicrobiales bacterium]
MDELERARRVLGIDRGATRADVNAAFRRAAKTHHPDAGGDAEKFVELRWAYERALAAAAAEPVAAAAPASRHHWYLDRVDPNPVLPRVVHAESRTARSRQRSSEARVRVVAGPSFASVLARRLLNDTAGV